MYRHFERAWKWPMLLWLQLMIALDFYQHKLTTSSLVVFILLTYSNIILWEYSSQIQAVDIPIALFWRQRVCVLPALQCRSHWNSIWRLLSKNSASASAVKSNQESGREVRAVGIRDTAHHLNFPFLTFWISFHFSSAFVVFSMTTYHDYISLSQARQLCYFILVLFYMFTLQCLYRGSCCSTNNYVTGAKLLFQKQSSCKSVLKIYMHHHIRCPHYKIWLYCSCHG